MPKLNVRNAGLSQSGGVNVRADAQAFGAGVGRAVQGLGATIGAIEENIIRTEQKKIATEQKKIATEQKKRAEEKAKAAKLEKARQTDIARDYISSSRNALALNAQEFAIKHPDATAEEKSAYFDEQAQGYVEGAPNDIAKSAISRNVDDVRFSVIKDAHIADAKRDIARRLDSFDSAISMNANIVQNDPSKLEERMAEVLGHIDNSTLIDENTRRDKRLEAQQALVNDYLTTKLDKDSKYYTPKSALNELRSGRFDKILDDKQKASFIGKATVEEEKQSFTFASMNFFAKHESPDERLAVLTDPVKAKKAGFDNFRDAIYLANTVRANQAEKRRAEAQISAEIRDGESRQVYDKIDAGDLTGAANIVKNSEKMSGQEKRNWAVTIRQDANITDPQRKTEAERAIANGSLKDSGEIRSLPGISTKDKEILVKKSDDRKANQGKINYMDSVMSIYDAKSKDNMQAVENRPLFQQMLQDFMEKNNLTEYDADVVLEAERINKKDGIFGFGTSPLDTFAEQRRTGIVAPTKTSEKVQPKPVNADTGLPTGVTEDDIKETMRLHNLSRSDVLERLNGR